MNKYTYSHQATFQLESGRTIEGLEIAYHTWGTLNANKSNVVWACHAFTGSSDVFDWWPGLFGDGGFFNPSEHFIICANILGSCYGTTGPLSNNPATGQPYYQYFPEITVLDVVNAHKVLANQIGIGHIQTLIGGSIGGQQALEWAIVEPDRIESLILIASNAQHSPWGIAFNESQRLAIKADRSYYGQSASGGQKGLQAARAIAMLSYRHYQTYQQTQADVDEGLTADFKAASYQRYQGEKLTKRFNAYSYVILSQMMDSHHVGRNRNGVHEALSIVKAKTLVVGINTDVLFPKEEQTFLANQIKGAVYRELDSLYGHDGFLIETAQLKGIINEFYQLKEGLTTGAGVFQLQ